MYRRAFVAAAAGAILAAATRSRAQATQRRIGLLSGFSRADAEPFLALLRAELDKLGWTEGRNVVYLEARTTEGRYERLRSLADDLVAERPDLVLIQSAPATRAMMQATKSIPIVMIAVGNPIESGIVSDFRRPGGNVTGSSYLADESTRKLLELLRQAAPRMRSVAVFSNPGNEAAAAVIAHVRKDAATYGIRAQIVEVSGPGDLDAAFAAIRREKSEAVLLPPEPLIRTHRGAIAEFAQAQGLPLAVVGSRRYLPPSGLISYGATTQQYAELTARYVDRIFKGANPADLPVEQPSRFELTINLKSARVLGLTIERALLQRADELIQ